MPFTRAVRPLVSVVMPFFNTPPQFITEAIESVRAQTYDAWELLLVDDGSTGPCSDLAKTYVGRDSGRMTYIEHPGHHNLGLSASRTAGVAAARGSYVAFLDSDDIWLPRKLERLLPILDARTDLAMAFGNTLYWSSWDPSARRHDFLLRPGVAEDTVFEPPALLPLLLRKRVPVPPPSSVVVRREALDAVGGFESAAPNVHEDQYFYAKLCLERPVCVIAGWWDQYRLHADSLCARAAREGGMRTARLGYLAWLDRYLTDRRMMRPPGLVEALRKERWLCGSWSGYERYPAAYTLARRTKKLWLRLEEAVIPAAMRRWLWARAG
jgi:glycosyltransferase involved in cell wall biosynthesis